MYGWIVYEAAQSRKPSSVGNHGDDAPLLGCCEDRVFLDYFCSLTVGGFSDGHCWRFDMEYMAFHIRTGFMRGLQKRQDGNYSTRMTAGPEVTAVVVVWWMITRLLTFWYSAMAILCIDSGKYFNQSEALRSRRMTRLLLIYADGFQEGYSGNYSVPLGLKIACS